MKKYIAKYEYHQPRLAEIEVIKETEKTITRQRGDFKELINHIYYLPDRLTRTDYNIFNTQEDALNWLISKAYNDIADLRLLIDKVQANIFSMSELREKTREAV